MNSLHLNQHKKQFLKWYLTSELINKVETCENVLFFICQTPEILSICKFVEDVDGSPRSLVVTDDQIQYVDDEIITVEPIEIINRIKQNTNDFIYVEIDFPGNLSNHLYVNILEENPFAGGDTWVSEDIKKEADEFLKFTLRSFQKKQLNDLIDKSLAEGNKEEFLKWTNLLIKDLL
jgi:uncharacterized protein YpiB (UPF0302 family)